MLEIIFKGHSAVRRVQKALLFKYCIDADENPHTKMTELWKLMLAMDITHWEGDVRLTLHVIRTSNDFADVVVFEHTWGNVGELMEMRLTETKSKQSCRWQWLTTKTLIEVNEAILNEVNRFEGENK